MFAVVVWCCLSHVVCAFLLVKEAATRLSLRSIRLGEYRLKPTQTRFTNNVIVGVTSTHTKMSKSITLNSLRSAAAAATTSSSSCASSCSASRASSSSSAASDASALLARVGEQLLKIEDRETRMLIVDLVRFVAAK